MSELRNNVEIEYSGDLYYLNPLVIWENKVGGSLSPYYFPKESIGKLIIPHVIRLFYDESYFKLYKVSGKKIKIGLDNALSISNLGKPLQTEKPADFVTLSEIDSIRLDNYSPSTEVDFIEEESLNEYFQKYYPNRSTPEPRKNNESLSWKFIINNRDLERVKIKFKPYLSHLVWRTQNLEIIFSRSSKYYLTKATEYLQRIRDIRDSIGRIQIEFIQKEIFNFYPDFLDAVFSLNPEILIFDVIESCPEEFKNQLINGITERNSLKMLVLKIDNIPFYYNAKIASRKTDFIQRFCSLNHTF